MYTTNVSGLATWFYLEFDIPSRLRQAFFAPHLRRTETKVRVFPPFRIFCEISVSGSCDYILSVKRTIYTRSGNKFGPTRMTRNSSVNSLKQTHCKPLRKKKSPNTVRKSPLYFCTSSISPFFGSVRDAYFSFRRGQPSQNIWSRCSLNCNNPASLYPRLKHTRATFHLTACFPFRYRGRIRSWNRSSTWIIEKETASTRPERARTAKPFVPPSNIESLEDTGN